MAAPKRMTPQRSRQLARRWTTATVAIVVVVGVLIVLGLDIGIMPAMLAFAYCMSREYRHIGWLDGYRARRDEEPKAPRLQVLRLPADEQAEGQGKPFALVLDGVPVINDQAAANVEATMKQFARECGGRTALVSTTRIHVAAGDEAAVTG
ncbi:MAG TPA: hypothetical protein VF174_09975 [Micromonosporaceae bacterium]